MAPALGVTGSRFLVRGLISTVVLIHATCTIHSLSHPWKNEGTRRPKTAGIAGRWWEIEPAFCLHKVLSWLGLVWDLRVAPQSALEANRVEDGNPDLGMLALQD